MRVEPTDILGNYIYTGEDYYETAVGPLRPDALREFIRYGNIVDLMYALWREDELGAKPYDKQKLQDLEDEIREMSVDEFEHQLRYSVWTAGERSLEDELFEKYRTRA